MQTFRLLVGALALLFCTGPLLAQPLVPLADTVEEPLLPPGISDQDVELFGNLVYLWTEGDGSEVIHVVGGFELHMGRRRLKAREAVAWMTPREFEGRTYNAFEIFLWRDARVIEPAGTATTGPALFATLNSFGKVVVSADRKTQQSSRATPVYAEAARIRARAGLGQVGRPEAPSPVTVLDLGPAGEEEKPVTRPVVSYRAHHLAVQQEADRIVVTAIGDVFVSRGDPAGLNTVEIRANAAVLYMVGEDKSGGLPTLEGPERVSGPPGADSPMGALPGLGALPGPGSSADTMFPSAGQVEAGYLEGDVILTYGDRTIRASQLYFDFQNDRALILDAVAFMPAPTRDVPIYVRAERVRQLSATEWTAYNAKLT
ncbi:MAG: hypothetical protein JXB13_14630, partial [Phycisphaerae bacterium]|nr:hypothetical protein [Phycisphaerae bacterium]